MRRGMMAARGLAGLWLVAGLLPAVAADFAEPITPGRLRGEAVDPLPRYFPRAEGEDSAGRRFVPARRQAPRCRLRRVPIPTDAPGDPSYVGSAYGLGKPSYYGFTPPLGVDDPYGRPLLPYCP
ncbi:hypothetical protein [Methylobacterium sp. J-068]|uniref:hypothetical protein n=1 Tax=Methylobacterium sp. J-068 TaxID=2836649 RepID=UPI001FBBC371|nr:hypothetical protein [Methylobacterium sp. J-068]MCJ2034211.1 hypothetical protein [Methylobacterium sp. J-068]